ncbi:transcription termination factor Rho [Gulosibacter bifidus]|uniref:Transcription termination factor Rho n=1 Tax=Gulosibacter bifidus TaxID=272239 RepID=A0ABW5RGJ7_9MICO|nr:transcription termination factor Rho [Gulosibacter bifidus]
MTDSNQNPASDAVDAKAELTETGGNQATTDRPLAQMRVADLQALASQLGVKGAARMRKSQLVEAVAAARGDKAGADAAKESPKDAPAADGGATEGAAQAATADTTESAAPRQSSGRRNSRKRSADVTETADAPASETSNADETRTATESDASGTETRGRRGGNSRSKNSAANKGDDAAHAEQNKQAGSSNESTPKTLDDIVLPPARDDESSDDDNNDAGQQNESGSGRKRNRNRNRNKSNDDSNNGQKSQSDQSKAANDRRRDRDRKRRDDVDPEIAPDDVLLPIAGILDVLDNYAFVRTSGYLAGPNDVYVSLGQVKKYNLRKGDAIVGAIRQPREGEYQSGRQKYNALVRIDTVNGEAPEPTRERAEFDKLTALYPNERITLETAGGHAAQRMIDLFAPIGKGTRGLIIAPPKSGKSILLERIAGAITENNPDTHLMLVLVDERPEEVTRLERTIHGEVISATFDMPAENHTTIAELAIERAKRLVELGLDVVVLLDSITQLGRAYNVSAPTTGRIIDGGVDASALYPPKRFFGAARNVENGGSLTILATAMVETGSRTDEVILEEFAGTANMELRLSRKIADKRIFPAIDIQQSSTLHEEELLSEAELAATWMVRRELGENAQLSLQAVLERLDSTDSNDAFVASVKVRGISTEATR